MVLSDAIEAPDEVNNVKNQEYSVRISGKMSAFSVSYTWFACSKQVGNIERDAYPLSERRQLGVGKGVVAVSIQMLGSGRIWFLCFIKIGLFCCVRLIKVWTLVRQRQRYRVSVWEGGSSDGYNCGR